MRFGKKSSVKKQIWHHLNVMLYGGKKVPRVWGVCCKKVYFSRCFSCVQGIKLTYYYWSGIVWKRDTKMLQQINVDKNTPQMSIFSHFTAILFIEGAFGPSPHIWTVNFSFKIIIYQAVPVNHKHLLSYYYSKVTAGVMRQRRTGTPSWVWFPEVFSPFLFIIGVLVPSHRSVMAWSPGDCWI